MAPKGPGSPGGRGGASLACSHGVSAPAARSLMNMNNRFHHQPGSDLCLTPGQPPGWGIYNTTDCTLFKGQCRCGWSNLCDHLSWLHYNICYHIRLPLLLVKITLLSRLCLCSFVNVTNVNNAKCSTWVFGKIHFVKYKSSNCELTYTHWFQNTQLLMCFVYICGVLVINALR